MSQRFVITGTGRSGTQWAAKTLRLCHLNVGHQAVFRHEQTLGRRLHWGLYHGDSSFEAVPLLHTLRHERIVVVTREPLAVMRSWRSRGLFVDTLETWEKWGLFSRVLDMHFPAVLAHPEPVGRAALYYVQWLRTAIKYAHEVVQLEGLTAKRLCEAVDRPSFYTPLADDLPTNINATPEHYPDRGPHSYDEIPEDVRDDLGMLAQDLGYA